jgi:hypothetical protein
VVVPPGPVVVLVVVVEGLVEVELEVGVVDELAGGVEVDVDVGRLVDDEVELDVDVVDPPPPGVTVASTESTPSPPRFTPPANVDATT